MVRHRWAFVLAASAGWLVPPGSALADCQPAGPIEQALRNAEVVFVGTVRATRAGGSVASFAVEEVWRGSLGEAVEVRGSFDGDRPGEDDRVWTVGQRYLVLPVQFDGALRDNICTATTEWRPEMGDLRPDGATGGGAGFPAAIVAPAFALLLLAVVGAVAFRRGSPA